jgi:peroxiredoxin
MRKILIIFSIFIAGAILLYLASLQFFKKATPEEVVFETFETKNGTTTQETTRVQKIDYLAPDFELLNAAGEKVKLGDHKGKIIILVFWTTWNPAAKDELAISESYYQEIKGRGDIILLAVNNQEDKSIVSNFIGRGEYGLPVLLDESGKTGELYGISMLPTIFFIDKEGTVKEVYTGILSKEEIKNKAEKLSTG